MESEKKSKKTLPPIKVYSDSDFFNNNSNSEDIFWIPEDPHWNEGCFTRFMRFIFTGVCH